MAGFWTWLKCSILRILNFTFAVFDVFGACSDSCCWWSPNVWNDFAMGYWMFHHPAWETARLIFWKSWCPLFLADDWRFQYVSTLTNKIWRSIMIIITFHSNKKNMCFLNRQNSAAWFYQRESTPSIFRVQTSIRDNCNNLQDGNNDIL